MPDKVNPNAPKVTPAPTMTIQVPAGMTAEQAQKLFGTFFKQNVRGKSVGKAIGETIKRLKKAHAAEYSTILKEEYVKQGLDPSTVK